MPTTPETRTIGQLVDAAVRAGATGGTPAPGPDGQILESVYVPTFQRFLVWNKAKRRGFIDSIHKGLPVGSLLLHREYPHEGQAQLTLIDGLQRMPAIREYVRAPLEYNQYRQIPADIRGPLEDALTAAGTDLAELDPAMDKWFGDVRDTELPSGYRPDRLLDHLTGELGAPAPLRDIDAVDTAAANFLHGLEKWVEIGTYLMPVLIYEGGEENLATAFELLNSQGTILSKYDIFAAQWATDKTRIANEKIREEAQVKYRAWEEAGWTVELPETDPGPDAHNLYEYLLGLGRHLTTQFPALFSRPAEGRLETESLAFVLASLAYALKPTKSQMPGLPGKMRGSGSLIDPGDFEEE